MGPDRHREIGNFDKRSVCFSTDFPSARALHAAGIRRAVLIQHRSAEPAVDLAETLVQELSKYMLALALVVDSRRPFAPAGLVAWWSPPRYPKRCFLNLEDARAWALEQMAGQRAKIAG